MMFNVAGMSVKVTQSSMIATLILLAAFTLLASSVLQLSIVAALLWGIAATLLYWSGEILHQYGHFIAARRIGYPMKGLRGWWFLGASIYPKDEPPLPASVHIHRALGGPKMSSPVGIVLSIAALLLQNTLPLPLWSLLALFAGLNLFLFGLGAFLPLGFTDGSTLLRYRNKP